MARSGLMVTGVIVVALLGAAGCTAETDSSPDAPQVTATADLEAVEKRWKSLTPLQRDAVCKQVLNEGGPDYRGMMNALKGAGLKQAEAAEMLPYAVNQCM